MSSKTTKMLRKYAGKLMAIGSFMMAAAGLIDAFRRTDAESDFF